jgi:hypothetical protein
MRYSVMVATPEEGTDAGFRASDFTTLCVSRFAAKPAPKAKRITGPKLFAAAIPTK